MKRVNEILDEVLSATAKQLGLFDPSRWQGNYLVVILLDRDTIDRGWHASDDEEDAIAEFMLANQSEPTEKFLLLKWNKSKQCYEIWKQEKIWKIIGNRIFVA